jgi:catechol 2,3-dioxygenase-like lactoylglutathione lyase family enzyme
VSGPSQTLAAVTYLVADYDEAIAWFTTALGFDVLTDKDLGDGKRWVEIGAGDGGVKLLLAKAKGVEQIAAIGAFAGDRVGFFLHTDDFDAKRRAMEINGVPFEEDTRHEPYGKVAVFRDLYGNRWDLLEPKA